jgi:N-methylhydantoinase B/oxoprolinase/acetone carboxylase alpha subunit
MVEGFGATFSASVASDDVIVIQTPGGGGYGTP